MTLPGSIRHLVSRERAVRVAGIGTACLFLAHALVRVIDDTIPEFAVFMAGQGFPQPTAVVWAITLVEILAAILLMLRVQVLLACAALASIAIGGIVLIHRQQGWFVGEHGTGGSEFSVALLLLLLVVAADYAKVVEPAPQGGPPPSGGR